MNKTIFYIGLAITGTVQDVHSELDINKIQKWLEEYAKIINGQAWKLWLISVDLSTVEDIEAALIEFLELYHKEEVAL